MRKFNSQLKNIGYFAYRLVSPVFDPIQLYQGITGYHWYLRDLIVYGKKSGSFIKLNTDLFPILTEKVSYTPFDAHYFYQQLWVFEEVINTKPAKHVDVGSTYEMCGYLSKITETTFIDLRPIDAKLPNLEVLRGDILHLPLDDSSAFSLSCLHVIEHIGLGRYGDEIDPHGSKKACQELTRVLAKGGSLYLSTPIGQPKLCFNAHKIFSIQEIIDCFKELKLVRLNIVDDYGNYIQDANLDDFGDLNYGCGMFHFMK